MGHFGQINMPHQPEGKGRYQHISEAKSLLSYFIYCFLHRKGSEMEKENAPTYLLLPLGIWGSKWGDLHWAMGCV